LKRMENFDRYGKVVCDLSGRVSAFLEKQPCASGDINGGAYIISKSLFSNENLPAKFSFEAFLESNVSRHFFLGCRSDAPFIDIGIPSDYEKAQSFLPPLAL